MSKNDKKPTTVCFSNEDGSSEKSVITVIRHCHLQSVFLNSIACTDSSCLDHLCNVYGLVFVMCYHLIPVLLSHTIMCTSCLDYVCINYVSC